MSGPKVVNIEALRRRQRRECNALLRDLTAAVEQCLSLQTVEDAELVNFRARANETLATLRSLNDAERWQELRQQTTAFRDFYTNESERLLRQQGERRAWSLRREHHIQQAASQSRAELRKLPASTERDDAIIKLTSTGDSQLLEAAVSRAMRILEAARLQNANASINRIRSLAQKFSPTNENNNTSRMPQIEQDPDECRLQKCCELLGELEALSDSTVAGWKQQAANAAAADASERVLLLDSLAINLATHLKGRRERLDVDRKIHSVSVAMEEIALPESKSWHSRLSAALAPSVSTLEARSIVESAQQWLDLELAKADTRAQRDAVLGALTALGYEIREGMASAWEEDGRVVVRKPNDSMYGIELTAPATGNNMQVRVVASTSDRNRQRDLEVEQTWCGEFSRLQSLLNAAGFPTRLTHANAPGEIPLKIAPNLTKGTGGTRTIPARRLSQS